MPTITVDGWPVIDPVTRKQTGHAPRQFTISEADLKHLSPEPADTVDAGKPPAAVVPTQAAAPARLLPTAELSSRQRSEQMDAVVEQVVVLNQQIGAINRLLGSRSAFDAKLQRDIAGITARLNELEAQWAAAQLKQPQSFGQRVRWMVFGR